MSLSYGKQDCNVLKIGLEGPGLGDYSHFLLFGGQWSRSLMPLQIGRPAAPSQSPGADPRAFTMGWGEKSSFNCSDGDNHTFQQNGGLYNLIEAPYACFQVSFMFEFYTMLVVSKCSGMQTLCGEILPETWGPCETQRDSTQLCPDLDESSIRLEASVTPEKKDCITNMKTLNGWSSWLGVNGKTGWKEIPDQTSREDV